MAKGLHRAQTVNSMVFQKLIFIQLLLGLAQRAGLTPAPHSVIILLVLQIRHKALDKTGIEIAPLE